jgi:Lipocalin-like domain
MNRRSIIQTSAITALGLVMSLNSAMAQTKSLKDQLVGSWTLVSAEPYGTNPTGSYMFDSNGRFSAILMRRDLPKYASNSRTQATAAEYKGTVDGSIAYFGTYSVSGNDLDLHIEGSTFPNWAGTVQNQCLGRGGRIKIQCPCPLRWTADCSSNCMEASKVAAS